MKKDVSQPGLSRVWSIVLRGKSVLTRGQLEQAADELIAEQAAVESTEAPEPSPVEVAAASGRRIRSV